MSLKGASAYACCGSVVHSGVTAPSYSLIGREATGTLTLKKENALVEGGEIVVLLLATGGVRTEKEYERNKKNAKYQNISQ